MSIEDDDLYPCVGICMVDEDSGRCMGCGRPVQEPAASSQPAGSAPAAAATPPDSR